MSQTLVRGSTQLLDGSVTAVKLAGSIALSQITGGTTLIKADGTVPFAATQSMGNFVLSNVADAVSAQDAVNLRTAQSLVNGIAIKRARAVAVANITLTGTQTIDGVALIAGDTVLLTAQTTASQNGLWTVAAGAWTRPTSWAAASAQKSTMFFVEEGTVNHDTKWLTITDAITVDTTSVSVAQDSSGTSYTNGSGISLTGNVFAVKLLSTGGLSFDGGGNVQIALNGASLNLSASGIKITDAASAGQVMIGGAANAATFATLSGDIASVSSAGVVALSTSIYKATNFVTNEVPSGTINGVNASFTLAATPTAGTEQLYLNGVRLFPGAGNDYTISGTAITMLNVPQTGDRLTSDYRK